MDVIVFDPSKINTKDLILLCERGEGRYGLVRSHPGCINPPIFILGKVSLIKLWYLEWRYGK